MVVNCLTHGDGEILALEKPFGMMERTQDLLKKCVACLAQGECVLAHCKHGIHRTGSFITVLLGMLLMMSVRSTTSLTSTMPTWPEIFERAWELGGPT